MQIDDDMAKEKLRRRLAGVAHQDSVSLKSQLSAALRVVESQRREIRDKNALLQQMIDQRDRFMGMAAHDLRNPLAVVHGYAEILQEDLAGIVDEEGIGLIQAILDASHRMRGLVEGILDAEAIAKGKVTLRLERVNLQAFVDRLSKGYALMARRKDLGLTARADDVWVSTDPLRLSQILDNLVSNALKYCSPHCGVHIDMRVDPSNQGIRVSVTDNGPGMTEAEVASLFRYFQTGSSLATRGETSYGLGLAITRSLVEAFEGSIDVQSTPLKGSVFTVHIPDKGETASDQCDSD